MRNYESYNGNDYNVIKTSGKTSLALSFIYNTIKNRGETPISILYYSFEMSKEALYAKLTSLYIYDTYQKIIPYKIILSMSSIISEEDYNMIKDSQGWIKSLDEYLTIYDKAYQGAVKGVNYGLISLDDLTNIRDLYQDYKKNIHEWINYVNDATSSFSHYQNFSDEMKNELKNELVSYQNGDLKRSSELESELINTISNDSNDDEEDTALINKRKMARNQMIDDLAKVMSNDNVATTTKKLKR